MGDKRIRRIDVIRTILLIFPFFSNYYQTVNIIVYYGFILWKIVVFVFLLSKVGRRIIHRCDKYIFCLIIMMVIYLVSTLFGNDTSLEKYISYLMTCWCMAFVPYYYFEDSNTRQITLYGILWALRLQLYLNMLLLLIHPEGIFVSTSVYRAEVFRYNFIGLDNQVSPYVITLLAFSLFYRKLYGYAFKFENPIDIIVSIATIILMGSATGIIGFVVFTFSWTLIKYGKGIFTLSRLAIFVALIFIVLLSINQIPLLSPLLELLGKGITFSGRTVIWESAIALIIRRPLIGYGITNNNIVWFSILRDYRAAHNEYLQICLNGGLAALIAFLTATSFSIRRYMKLVNKNKYIGLVAGLLSMMMMMLAETYIQMVCFYLILSALYFAAKYEYHYRRF